MTLVNFAYFVAGLCLGIAGGLTLLGLEQRAWARQVREIVAAYEARIAEILGRARG